MTPLQSIIRLPDGLHVRLQVLGQGPAVILCHESPRSSSALLVLAMRLQHRFSCIMLDTPGFGLSDPLTMTRPEVPDFAGVVLNVIKLLGLGRVPVYGTHTGAAIAVEAALQAPDQVSTAILDGYAIFTEVERDQFLVSYLHPFRPAMDGSLAAWLWSRVRDQFTAFPWNQVGDGSKLGFGPPPLSAMQKVVEDLLLAGDAYRAGYSAAFRYDHFAPLAKLRCPVYIATREDDLLFAHMERARGSGDQVNLIALSPDRDVWGDTIGRLITDHAGPETLSAQEIIIRAEKHSGTRRIVNTTVGPVVIRIDGEGDTVVMLHDVPGDMADLDHLTNRLRRSHRVVRVNLPGFGLSSLAQDASVSMASILRGVDESLAAAGATNAPVIACGASLPVAMRLAGDPQITALDPWPQVVQGASEHLPDLAPRWDGSHLMAAFWWARDYEIYKPWYNRVNTELRSIGNERDTDRIHLRFQAIVMAGETGISITRLLYETDVACALAAAAHRLRVLVTDGDPDSAALVAWGTPHIDADRITPVPRPPEQLAQILANLLS